MTQPLATNVANPLDHSAAPQASTWPNLVDWTPRPVASHETAYAARNVDTGQVVEVRLLPWLMTSEQRRSLGTQCQLIRLVAASISRPIVGLALDETPVRVALSDHPNRLAEFLKTATSGSRLEYARQLVAAFQHCFLNGLLHGNLTVDHVYVDEHHRIRIDFLARFYRAETATQDPDFDSDAKAVADILRQLLGPLKTDSRFLTTCKGHRRAQFQNLIQTVPSDGTELQVFDRWIQWLDSHLEANVPDPVSIGESAPGAQLPVENGSDDNDTTCEIEIPEMSPVVSDDLTREIGVDTEPSVAHNLPSMECGQTLGRYRLEKLLGVGGMGMVYQATDLASGDFVAVKILRPTGGNVAHAVRRFRKEARLLATVQNPNVTSILDSGFDNQVHYLVLEFVDGPNLKSWLEQRSSLRETDALQVICDIARGLVEAHRQQVIHRDIKPENILLAKRSNGIGTENHSNPLTAYQIKITDFGIARTIQQSASMEVTRAGALLGTPTYMAPEQFKGTQDLDASCDIYSMGVLLFQLLTGSLPFHADDPMKLAAMHCFDAPPDLRKRNPDISETTVALLNRMLSKTPEDRPADAAQLVDEIESMLRGETSNRNQPTTPAADPDNLWEKQFTWDLQSSPSELWPHVSNTERLNRAAGLKAVTYRTEKKQNGGQRKLGSVRLGAVLVEWEEHPFEWIENRRVGILREFSAGPFRWFLSSVTLTPRPEGGTRLVHKVQIDPRHSFGRMLASIEAGWKGGKALDRIYQRIDHAIQHEKGNHQYDPYEPTAPISQTQRRRLEHRRDQMVSMGISLDLATHLVDYLEHGNPQTLAQIRPLELADQLKRDGELVTEACLVAVKCGLLRLRWDVLCPTCRAAANTVGVLSEIDQHTECQACDAAFQSDVAAAIELVFQAHPEVCEVDQSSYCIGGPEHSPHVVAQLRIAPQERLQVPLTLAVGHYLLRDNRVGSGQTLQVQSDGAPRRLDLRLSDLGSIPQTTTLRSGSTQLFLHNDTADTQTIRLERRINRSRVVTAARASALPRFRQLFPDQVFRKEGAVSADDLSLFAIRISSAQELYDSRSDTEAYGVVRNTLELFEQVIQSHQGAVIKTIGDLLLASFQEERCALAAALEIGRQISQAKTLTGVRFAGSIHRGPLLVTTQNGRLDYFGTTARQVISLAERINDGIALTDIVFTDPQVQSLLDSTSLPLEHQLLDLPGSQPRLVQIVNPLKSATPTDSQPE